MGIDSTLFRVFKLVDQSKRVMLGGLIVVQILLGILDFFGVLLFGVLGGLAIHSVTKSVEITQVNSALSIINIDSFSLSAQMVILGWLVFSIFAVKTFLAITLTKSIMRFVGGIATQISEYLITETLRQPILFLKKESTHKRLFAITRGVDYVTSFVLAPLIVFVADGAILLIFITGLFLVQPTMTLALVMLFALLGLIVQRRLNVRSRNLGEECADLNIKTSSEINEVFNLYREITVRNARGQYIKSIVRLRQDLALKSAAFSLIPYLGKYFIEASVIFFAVFLTMAQLVNEDPISGVTTLTVFLAASTRLAPALLRVQQSVVTVKGNLGLCVPTLNYLEELQSNLSIKSTKVLATVPSSNTFVPEVKLENINFRYGNNDNFDIENLNFTVSVGEKVAIVGPSGSGKSTMVDIILGIISPQTGSVKISSLEPLDCFEIWPRKISYVPQDVGIITGTIRENLLLGHLEQEISDKQLMNVLESVGLSDYVAKLPTKLDFRVGERGAGLSAGQKQRIGLARALIVQPSLLILDESTSSLDAQSEAKVTGAISNLGDEVTVIVVAHRLSTVLNADRVVYVDSGKILATGTFNDVRNAIRDFDRQARLSGL